MWKAETEMLFDGRRMEGEKVDEQEVWSAIRYLDPDEKARDKDKDENGAGNTATIIAALALLFIVCAVWALLWLRLAAP